MITGNESLSFKGVNTEVRKQQMQAPRSSTCELPATVCRGDYGGRLCHQRQKIILVNEVSSIKGTTPCVMVDTDICSGFGVQGETGT